ncbi:hypothetical protein ACT453_60330, partial [Bacillus sp. D-CC]
NDSELLTVKGIGEHKLVKYGSHFLQAVQHFIDENPNYAETIKTEVRTILHKFMFTNPFHS